MDDNNVYRTDIDATDYSIFHLYAWNRQSGELVWDRLIKRYNIVAGVGEPSVSGGIVYVNRAGHSDNNGGIATGETDAELPRVFGLDATTGVTVMEARYAAQLGSTDRPTIDGNQLFAETGVNGGFSAYNAATLQQQYFVDGHNSAGVKTLDAENVYALGPRVYRRIDGLRLPDLSEPSGMRLSLPVVSDSGRVYYSADRRIDNTFYFGVAAYDAQTHVHLYTAPTFNGAVGLAVGNGIIAANERFRLQLLSEATGDILWTWKPPATMNSDVVLTKSHVFVSTNSSNVSKVFAFRISDGAEVWSHEYVGPVGTSESISLALVGKHLYVSGRYFVSAFAADLTNQLPTPVDDHGTTNEDRSVVIPVLGNDSDDDGDTLSITAITQPLHGTATANLDGSITYTPTHDYFGADSFTYTVSDGQGGTATAAVTIDVAAVNDFPTVVDDSIGVHFNTPINFSPLDNDSCAPDVGETLTITSFGTPTCGTLTVTGSNFRYVPRRGYRGTDSFWYTVDDGNGGTATGMVNVYVIDTIAPKLQSVYLHYGVNQVIDLKSSVATILPWENIHSVELRFSERVNVADTDLSLTGRAGPYHLTYDGFNSTTYAATWTLDSPIDMDRLELKIASGIKDLSGNKTAKGWTRHFAVLPGDYNGDGWVNGVDLTGVTSQVGRWRPFADIDGDGFVTSADVARLRANLGRRLL